MRPAKAAAGRLDDERLSILSRRTRTSLWILFGLGCLATAVDLFSASPHRVLLVAAGAGRLAALLGLLALLGRVSGERAVVAIAVAGVGLILAIAIPLGALRDEFGTALLIDCGLSIAVGAFLPWGWRAQLLAVTGPIVGMAATLAMFEFPAIGLQQAVQVVGCLALSVYLAVDQERLQRELAHHDAEIASTREELLRMNEELERRVVAREALLASARQKLAAFCESLALDLRPNLAQMRTDLASIARTLPPERSPEGDTLATRIGLAVDRMEATLDATLDYMALARVPLHPVTVDLSRVAADYVGRLRKLEPERHLEVTIRAGMSARADAMLIGEAIGHLVENAWKFTGERADARIEVGQHEDAAGRTHWYVRDNGVGFDMNHYEKLFRPFSRLEAIDRFPGHGMGLARTARIIARHGGSIAAQATPGGGAEFRFSLGT